MKTLLLSLLWTLPLANSLLGQTTQMNTQAQALEGYSVKLQIPAELPSKTGYGRALRFDLLKPASVVNVQLKSVELQEWIERNTIRYELPLIAELDGKRVDAVVSPRIQTKSSFKNITLELDAGDTSADSSGVKNIERIKIELVWNANLNGWTLGSSSMNVRQEGDPHLDSMDQIQVALKAAE